jgi:hypothetical protein
MNADNHPSIDHAMRIIKQVREIARAHGWGIGVHGSLMRDIDLIAVPWTSEACSTSDLLATLMAELGATAHGGNPSWRAHGRRTFLLLADHAESQQERFNDGRDPGPIHPKGIWYPPAIDLSVIDPRERAP